MKFKKLKGVILMARMKKIPPTIRGFHVCDIPVKDMQQSMWEHYVRNYETMYHDNGYLYFRRKKNGGKRILNDVARQNLPKPLTKFQKFWRRFKFLTAILILILSVNWYLVDVYYNYPEVLAKTLPDNPELPTVNLSPVSFTEAEKVEITKRLESSKKENWTVEQHIEAVFGKDTDWALKCLQSENRRLNPYAVNHNRNGSVDRGVFQINSVHCGKVKAKSAEDCANKLFDVETNVKVAYQIFKSSGSKAWYGKTCN
jgi:hypothetical protein